MDQSLGLNGLVVAHCRSLVPSEVESAALLYFECDDVPEGVTYAAGGWLGYSAPQRSDVCLGRQVLS